MSKMKFSTCEGNCHKHKGKVKKCSVICNRNIAKKDWGYFWYCENAIEHYRKNGFTITVEE